jgi:hypothetical protein
MLLLTTTLKLCIGFQLINLSGEEWNYGRDVLAMRRAIKVCREEYSGCLSKFIKKEPGNYAAICRKDGKGK